MWNPYLPVPANRISVVSDVTLTDAFDEGDEEDYTDTDGAGGGDNNNNNNYHHHRQTRNHNHHPRSPNDGTVISSTLEYSDTSEDDEGKRRGRGKASRGQQHNKQSQPNSKSSFRLKKESYDNSSRTVRFGNATALPSLLRGGQTATTPTPTTMEVAPRRAAARAASSKLEGNQQPFTVLPEQSQQHTSALGLSWNRETSSDSNIIEPPPPPPDGRMADEEEEEEEKDASEQKHHGSKSPTPSQGWVAKLAYSFRSPAPPTERKHYRRPGYHHHNILSSDQVEYPQNQEDEIIADAPVKTRKSSRLRSKSWQESLKHRPPTLQLHQPPVSMHSHESAPLLGDASLLRGENNNNNNNNNNNINKKAKKVDNNAPASPYRSLRNNAGRSIRRNYVEVAAAFLQDYESGRAPTLSTTLTDITDWQMNLYRNRFGYGHAFGYVLLAATLGLFGSSMLEGFDEPHQRLEHMKGRRVILTALNFGGMFVLTADMIIRRQLRGGTYDVAGSFHHTRLSRSERLVQPLVLFMTVLVLENVARLCVDRDSNSIIMFSSLFKPLALFYISNQGRDAAEAVRRIFKIVTRVIIMELLLILMFAAVACVLFRHYPQFSDLSTAWLSLFELSTTVVNPSLWMPIYEVSPLSCIFFITFIITSVFYLHSLVLSVVFSTYIKAAAEIHERNAADREDAIQLAYMALQTQQFQKNVSSSGGGRSSGPSSVTVVDISLVRSTLRMVRPHYNAMKINALIEIVDPSNQRSVNLATFRTKIRQALNASIRTARTATTLATSIELIAVAVSVVNFIYVILVSSRFSTNWFETLQKPIGALITLVAGFELLIRFNPLRIPDFTPLTRLNPTFDGLALLASLISCIGIFLYIFHQPMSLEYLLMGRAVDMIRIMRFFQIFRDIVRRSSDVLPALAGPIVLVITTVHIFVYLGMALWGGSVAVGEHEGEIEDLYDLNNFNSYAEGAVTMFQVLVVNDWHAIAQVFTFAGRCSSPFIVYPFFVIANLVGVSIMLNVLTAFFVESFVTKLEEPASGHPDTATTTTVQKERDFSIVTSEHTSKRRVASGSSRKDKHDGDMIDHGADADSEGSSEDVYEFDVYEREGFDKIMQTVSGGGQNNDFAERMCSYFEIFEGLSPGRETVGYLVCDQRTLERFGNRRFQTKAVGFLQEHELNLAVSTMHSELLALSARASFNNDRALIRTFPHRLDPSKKLEISASLLRRHPAVSLFVTRTRQASDGAEIDE